MDTKIPQGFWATIWKLFKIVWKGFAFLNGLLAIILFWSKLKEASVAYPWWHNMMPSRESALIAFSAVCVGYIIWMDLRPWYQSWRASRKKNGLLLSFEPKAPWVRSVAAQTHSKNDVSVTVTTPSLWYRVSVGTLSQRHRFSGVLPYLIDVERQLDGCFVGVGFGQPMQLRWANEFPHAEYQKKNVDHFTSNFVDIFSVDEEHNKIFVKWRIVWTENQNIFDVPGVYRLTILSKSEAGAVAEIKLCVGWTGRWDQTQVWEDKNLPVAEEKKA
jgi:hypothetical protein